MSDKEWKRTRRRRKQESESLRGMMDFPYISSKDISREKNKARELRNSAWWKRKIAEGKCHYCGKSFPQSELTMDHKIPLARGGRSEKSNLVPCCKECNTKKKYLLPLEWEEYMNRIRNS